MNLDHLPKINCRLATKTDFPIMAEMYSKLNTHLNDLGYNLPRPKNIGRLWLDSFKRTLGRFSNAWVAEVDNIVVGFILCRVKRLPAYMGGIIVGELSDIWIDPEARRYGIGDKLTRIALVWLREQETHSVETQVLISNEASWNMIARMGFKKEFHAGRLVWSDYVEEPPI